MKNLVLTLCLGFCGTVWAAKEGRPQVPSLAEPGQHRVDFNSAGDSLQGEAQSENAGNSQAVSVCHFSPSAKGNEKRLHTAQGRYRVDSPEGFQKCSAQGGKVENGMPPDQKLPILKN